MSLYGWINNKERYNNSGMFGTSLDFSRTEMSLTTARHLTSTFALMLVICKVEFNKKFQLEIINMQNKLIHSPHCFYELTKTLFVVIWVIERHIINKCIIIRAANYCPYVWMAISQKHWIMLYTIKNKHTHTHTHTHTTHTHTHTHTHMLVLLYLWGLS